MQGCLGYFFGFERQVSLYMYIYVISRNKLTGLGKGYSTIIIFSCGLYCFLIDIVGISIKETNNSQTFFCKLNFLWKYYTYRLYDM